MDIIRQCTEEENKTLNEYAASCCESWEDKGWGVYKQKENGTFWYSVLDDDGKPTDDNIIEGSTGEMMYLDLDDAKEEWGVPMTLMELTEKESGCVVNPDGDAIICNWSSLDEGKLPYVFVGGIVGLGDVDFAEAQSIEVNKETLDCIGAFLYIENEGDDEGLAEDIANGEGKGWELPDGTIIIVCKNWN